ncbi:hypothetical protein [Pantoea sp. UBA4549]|nr:hypothetical protein [Pantoea sp. UBA4549]
MKIGLNLSAGSISVLALNMGKIALKADGNFFIISHLNSCTRS